MISFIVSCLDLSWDVSYASAVALLAPSGKHVQLKECCGHEQHYRSRLSHSTPPPHQNLQPQILHNMENEEHNNGQRSPPCVPKTVDHTSKELPKLYWDARRLKE